MQGEQLRNSGNQVLAGALGLVWLLCLAGAASAESPAAPAPLRGQQGGGAGCELESTQQPDTSFVAELRERYGAYRKAALDGNLQAVRSTRASAIVDQMETRLDRMNRLSRAGSILREAESKRLPLDAYDFLQADRCGERARLAFRKSDSASFNFLIVMFEREDGVWKVGRMRRASLDRKIHGNTAPSLESQLETEDVQL